MPNLLKGSHKSINADPSKGSNDQLGNRNMSDLKGNSVTASKDGAGMATIEGNSTQLGTIMSQPNVKTINPDNGTISARVINAQDANNVIKEEDETN
jgi:hypothetical protein